MDCLIKGFLAKIVVPELAERGIDAMKKCGILNAELAAVVAAMGHLDMLTVADAGLPIPDGPKRIDLVVRPNLPNFLDVTATVLEEMAVQEVIIAREMAEVSALLYAEMRTLLQGTPVRFVSHEEFKALTVRCKAVVRTGEFTPYANVILVSGVVF
jgi:D-ribose pyranase